MPKLDAIGIVAQDLEEAVAFYSLFGLGFDRDPDPSGHVEATLANGIRVMIDTEDVMSSFSDWAPPTGGGRRVALAFVCDSPAEVDRVHGAVVAAGHTSKVDPFDAPWGQRYATLLDPDGNPVDLFAPLR